MLTPIGNVVLCKTISEIKLPHLSIITWSNVIILPAIVKYFKKIHFHPPPSFSKNQYSAPTVFYSVISFVSTKISSLRDKGNKSPWGFDIGSKMKKTAPKIPLGMTYKTLFYKRHFISKISGQKAPFLPKSPKNAFSKSKNTFFKTKNAFFKSSNAFGKTLNTFQEIPNASPKT